jgi:hypothetical protein
LPIHCGARRAFMASRSSLASRSPSRQWPTTWREDGGRRARAGRPFCTTTRPASRPMDLLVVPTIGFRLLYVLMILGHYRRRLLSFGVTSHPTAEWIARQITDAFPRTEAPRHLIRDRDAVYGQVVGRRLKSMGIRDRPTAPRSPWQNGYVERLIGSIRREIGERAHLASGRGCACNAPSSSARTCDRRGSALDYERVVVEPRKYVRRAPSEPAARALRRLGCGRGTRRSRRVASRRCG